jgi:methylase of polypeptide subunit release factors
MAAGGFDIIVGNPPYVRIQNMEDQFEKRFYAEYFGAATGSFDLSVAFVEMALKLLKPGGVAGLIVSGA